MQLLIVDDQPRARQSMKALMRAWHEADDIYEATDGAEAVKLAKQLQPDLILMDARMPKMDGLEAIQIIKAHSREIKIIVLSMYPDIRDMALEAGADAFVSKGDPPEVLREVVVKVMEQH